MAVTLILETGESLVDSNTYCSKAEGDTYHEERLHVSTWTNATDDEKNRGLVSATKLLDQLIAWHGYKTDDDQALRWPRGGVVDIDGNDVDDDIIPAFLRDATAEFARLLIASDRSADADTYGFKEIAADTLKLVMDKRDRRPVLPESVRIMVSPYGSTATRRARTLVRE